MSLTDVSSTMPTPPAPPRLRSSRPAIPAQFPPPATRRPTPRINAPSSQPASLTRSLQEHRREAAACQQFTALLTRRSSTHLSISPTASVPARPWTQLLFLGVELNR